MKIPEIYQYELGMAGDSSMRKIIEAWQEIAIQMSAKYGIFVEVILVRNTLGKITELQFRFDNNDFDSSEKLERTLRLKAFL